MSGRDEYTTVVKGESQPDDGLRVEIAVEPRDWWSNLQDGDCPDCGGRWVWFEAGYVPGTRKCIECGSLFTVLGAQYDEDRGESAKARGVAVLRRERFYSP